MALIVRMPALSPTMETGTLAKWLVVSGDRVEPGVMIAEIETDKATMEVEAVDEGIMGKVLVEEGQQDIKVNAPIAVILEEGEDESVFDSLDLSLETAKKNQSEVVKESEKNKDIQIEKETVQKEAVQKEKKLSSEELPIMDPSFGHFFSAQAEEDPIPDKNTKWVSMTVRDALRDAMAEEMRKDPNVLVMGEEVAQYQGAYKVTRELLQEFGENRVIDTPITEHGFAGLGVGAAFAGLRPIVEFMTMNFAMQAIDHIINSAGKTLYMSGGQMGCPIVFRGPNGAAARVGAQHSQDYSSWYAHIPGLIVVAPYDAADAKGLLKAAIREPNPVVFLENELLYGESFEVPVDENWVLPIGKASVKRSGQDVTITAHSKMVSIALQAAEEVSKEGISVEVIDLRTLRPLDTDTVIRSVMKTNRLVCIEEGWVRCGVGAEVIASVMAQAFDYLDAPPARVHQEDVPLPYAANLEALSLPDVKKTIMAIKAVLYKN